MDRRTYLRYMALATGGLALSPSFLVSCSSNKEKRIGPGVFKMEPFKSLEQIRFHARSSKGHLKKEMYRRIKEKNPKNIFQFVQQHIATVPPNGESVRSSAYATRWGMDGVLRCGKGTLREKCDLLHYMLEKAGFSPKLYRVDFPMTPAKVTVVFCQDWVNNDQVEVSEEYLKQWNSGLHTTQNSSVVKSVETSGREQLTKNLLNLLPKDFAEGLATFYWLDVPSIEAPTVRVQTSDGLKDLHFMELSSYESFGEITMDVYEIASDSASQKLDKIRVVVEASFAQDPHAKIPLVSGEWPLSRAYGNPLALQFLSPLPQEVLLETPFEKIQQFVPTLSLQNPNFSQAEAKSNSFQGKGFDLMGNTFEENSSGVIEMNGVPIDTSGSSDTSTVSSLKVVLLDDQYPKIKLRCAPLDASGKVVHGLNGSAFEIFDSEKQQFAVVEQNSVLPRVLVLFDATASMPYPYAALEIPKETMEVIETGLDGVQIETKSYELEFLETLKSIELRNYDHILCIGDGEAFETVTGEQVKHLVGKTPISYHYIKNGDQRQSQKDVQKCFSEAGFPVYAMETLKQDLSNIQKQTRSGEVYPYLLSYLAPSSNDTKHTVKTGIAGNNTVKKVASFYKAKPEFKAAELGFPCGISIRLDWDEGYSSRSLTRHVVGFNPNLDDQVNLSHIETIRSFALGTHRIFFEPDKATLPVLLDQVISAQLTVAPFFEDKKTEIDEQLKQINQFAPVPSAGISIFAPLPRPGGDSITFENNFQTCFYSEWVNFQSQESIKKMDIWPTSDVRTFATTKKQAFSKNISATALLAFSEAHLFSQSTCSELKDKALQYYTYGAIDFTEHSEFKPLDNDAYAHHLIYDSSYESAAYWRISKETGAVLGILPDGSGGGIEASIAHNLKIIDSYASAYNKAAAPLMSDPLAFGTVTMYGQFLARLYGLVCVAVLSLDAAQLPAKSRQAIKKLAYGVIKSFAFAKFGKLKQFEKILDKLFDPGWPKMK